ncbi:hypothetical protein DSM107010_04760 [Chroococcidiopsis cubana SAG 39.79]|uniref:Uncharacterized protein n=2 Tax=Chroococcidiopsis TaxID=54298 RepID=A0AB37USX7_9CYAN|nr:hypothetical protein C7B79_29415 [Chroococcidiopsis cubana CCALA 043]RUT14445.1 hypothetical protein DSM107010_04760 [Chroococcidiopsis cubana SAG 39.79]
MLNLRSDNPFVKFKTRNIFILLLILIVEFVFISDLLLLFFNWNSDDPIFYDFIYYLMMLLPSIWILHRCHQLSIHPKYLIGKLPSRDRWLSLCGIAIAHAINNAATIVLEFFFPSEQITINYNFSEYLHWGLVLTIVTVPFMIRFVYKNWYKQQLALPYFANVSHRSNRVC